MFGEGSGTEIGTGRIRGSAREVPPEAVKRKSIRLWRKRRIARSSGRPRRQRGERLTPRGKRKRNGASEIVGQPEPWGVEARAGPASGARGGDVPSGSMSSCRRDEGGRRWCDIYTGGWGSLLRGIRPQHPENKFFRPTLGISMPFARMGAPSDPFSTCAFSRPWRWRPSSEAQPSPNPSPFRLVQSERPSTMFAPKRALSDSPLGMSPIWRSPALTSAPAPASPSCTSSSASEASTWRSRS